MTKLPITLLFFTSTRGHYQYKDIYLSTLRHFDRQLPLSAIATKIAHIKVSEHEETVGEEMERELTNRGFRVIKTVANWSRGMAHQQGYLADMIRVSKEPSVYENEHILFCEDDSTLEPKKMTLTALLCQMRDFLKNPEVVTVRLVRPGDERAAPILQASMDHFYSEHINLQPLMMRSRDFYLMLKMAEDQIQSANQMQIEMLWRVLLSPFSRSPLKHVVYWPEVASTTHLGVPDYPVVKDKLGL